MEYGLSPTMGKVCGDVENVRVGFMFHKMIKMKSTVKSENWRETYMYSDRDDLKKRRHEEKYEAPSR
jgi:hypothetical protein